MLVAIHRSVDEYLNGSNTRQSNFLPLRQKTMKGSGRGGSISVFDRLIKEDLVKDHIFSLFFSLFQCILQESLALCEIIA